MPAFRVARLEAHGHLLPAARDDASLLFSRAIPRSRASAARRSRHLLYLFERDEAVRLIRCRMIVSYCRKGSAPKRLAPGWPGLHAPDDQDDDSDQRDQYQQDTTSRSGRCRAGAAPTASAAGSDDDASKIVLIGPATVSLSGKIAPSSMPVDDSGKDQCEQDPVPKCRASPRAGEVHIIAKRLTVIASPKFIGLLLT